ncbi:MAG TPA: glycerophosphodiester phosphodiesterase [Burkholderiales bacterium]|nr:glycerophosphodiester phosphodiesterase [Burkholderiales bacterium]
MMKAAPWALELQGHRGARGLSPENTLPGFAHALGIGVSAFELDCAITRDGVVVISHDPLLNPDITRTPDGKWLDAAGPAIFQLSYAEVLRYDVGRIKPGSEYAGRFSGQQPVDGTRIPRLADLFALTAKAGNDTVRFNLELKLSPFRREQTADPATFARKVIAAVRDGNVAARTAILSFDWEPLKVVQEEAPEIPTVYLTAQQAWQDNILAARTASPWTEPLHVSRFGGSIPRMIEAAGGAVWSCYYEEIRRDLIDEARRLGLKVLVWTVNDMADMRRMIEWRVDGIVSDRPDLLRKVAGELGIVLPRATPVAP